ncbi:hypothetical protein HN873_002481, partial [Arachis hypogaea]
EEATEGAQDSKKTYESVAIAASESGAGTVATAATTRVLGRAAFGCVCKGWRDSGILLRLNGVRRNGDVLLRLDDDFW